MPVNVETSIGKQDVLQIVVLPLEADARDVVFILYAPPEISLTDPQSKEFKTLAKDQKITVPFNYSATTDGTFNITLEVKTKFNSTKFNATINVSVPAPRLEIGEFWVYNQTKGNALGLQVQEVIRKDTIDGKEYYVIKGTWEGEPNGTYFLSYNSVDTFSEKMIEYYEDGLLLKEKTVEMDPPSYLFPFKVGMKGSWSGSITGIGKVDINTEVVKKEQVTVPSGTYKAHYIRKKMSFSMATGVEEEWYVPELNGIVKGRLTTNALGVTEEIESELVEHGKPPAAPPQVQPDLKIPEGYKLYKDDELNFRIAYPKNWKFNPTEDSYGSYFNFEDGSVYAVVITVKPIGKLNLTEYQDTIIESGKKLLPGTVISEKRRVTINGRDGAEWVQEFPPLGLKMKWVVFVVDDKGYVISGGAFDTVYNSYKPIFDNIVNSFFIKGKPNKFTLS